MVLAALLPTPVVKLQSLSAGWGLWGQPPPRTNPSQSCFSEVLGTWTCRPSPWLTLRNSSTLFCSLLPRDPPRFLGASPCTFCQISSNCSTPSDTFLRQRSISPGQGGRQAVSILPRQQGSKEEFRGE